MDPCGSCTSLISWWPLGVFLLCLADLAASGQNVLKSCAGRRAPHTSAALLSSHGIKWHRICSQHGHLAHLCPGVLFKIIQELDMTLNSRLMWHTGMQQNRSVGFHCLTFVAGMFSSDQRSSDRADAGHGFCAVLSGRREGNLDTQVTSLGGILRFGAQATGSISPD